MTEHTLTDVREKHHPALRVQDVQAAAEFYTSKLGFRLGFTWGDPTEMVGVNIGTVQVLLVRGTPRPDTGAVCFLVGNADELYEYQHAQGVQVLYPPGDRRHGLRDYAVRDLDGYELRFGHQTFSDGPAIEIERVDVRVRLERRLAALLEDLADFKCMSLSSCLEETLLHTLDGVGPHTRTDLRRIQELKRKHAIDYDTYGSYRFVERDPASEW